MICRLKSIDKDKEYPRLVGAENKRCDDDSLKSNPPAILVKHIRKVYPVSGSAANLAVDDITFHLEKGKCLALLGTNGAGKSTTFKLLTRDEVPSAGEIFIYGKELKDNFTLIRKQIGNLLFSY